MIQQMSFNEANIMVVDDIAYNANLSGFLAADTKLTVIEAMDGENCLDLLQIQKPDLIPNGPAHARFERMKPHAK